MKRANDFAKRDCNLVQIKLSMQIALQGRHLGVWSPAGLSLAMGLGGWSLSSLFTVESQVIWGCGHSCRVMVRCDQVSGAALLNLTRATSLSEIKRCGFAQ